jgi:hypothetical protein
LCRASSAAASSTSSRSTPNYDQKLIVLATVVGTSGLGGKRTLSCRADCVLEAPRASTKSHPPPFRDLRTSSRRRSAEARLPIRTSRPWADE